MFIRSTILLPALLLALWPQARAATPPALSQAWEDAALNLTREAHRSFAALDGREARFGEAVTMLQLQPKTDPNIERAANLLEEVVAERADDELGIAARFYLGRLEQVHRTPLNPEAAAEHFAVLLRDFPGHPLTEQAVVKLALLELYAPGTPAEQLAAFEKFRRLGEELKTHDAIRDLNLTLGNAAQRLALGDELALPCYIAAYRAGIHLTSVRGDTLVSIGELARKTGRHELAREHYQRFLEEFKRDNRRLTIRERLDSLPAPRP
ncbi:MAG: hypothetical protein ABII82_13825 [Verrucomicrobiota bacterium]